MSSQLRAQDKQRLLSGKTKMVGMRPYENGMWGFNSVRDRVIIEIYDSTGNFIEYRDLSVAEAFVEVEDFIKLKPGKNLSENFDYKTGKFRVRYRFIRELAGKEKPILLRTKTGFESEIFPVSNTADNIFIDDTGKIYKGTLQEFNANPAVAEQLLLTDYKYKIDKISSSRTEVRLTAKNIQDISIGGGSGHQYITDFQKLQESTRVEGIPQTIEFIDVVPNTSAPGFNASMNPFDPALTDLNTTNSVKLTAENGGFVFTDNMQGGTLTLPSAFLMGYETTPVRTELNIITNDSFEDVEIDGNTASPAIINASWDESIHNDAVKLIGWSSGFNTLDGTQWAGSSPIGYHAKFVRNEGNAGGICIKFIDQNNVYGDYDAWPDPNTHREMSVKQQLLELQSLGAGGGDIINFSLDMKSTVAGKGISIEVQYPGEIFIENEPTAPPEGYFNPLNPHIPTEEIPASSPDGFLDNTNGNASTIEEEPPSRASDIINEYGLEFFVGEVGVTTTADFGGEGVWIVTSQTGFNYQWGPNLGPEHTKEGELSEGGEWKWDGAGAWTPISPGAAPVPPAGTVSPDDFDNLSNGHPYQLPGQGIPVFQRNTMPGENAGWQTGTIVGQDKIILIKDDLIWLLKESFTANADDVEVFKFDDWFPSVRNFVIEDTGKTLYEDIFENGYIQSITRTRRTNNSGIRTDYYIVYYTNGSGENDCNRAFMVEKGASEIGGGGSDDGLKKWSEIDGDFNNVLNENGGQFETMFYKDGDLWKHYFTIKGSNQYWRMIDGDGDFFEEGGGGTFFDTEEYPAPFDGSEEDKGFSGLPSEWDVAFSKSAYSGHWSVWSCIIGDTYYKMKSKPWDDGVDSSKGISSFAFEAGEVGTGGVDLIFGPRNPAADNYNPLAIYDDGSEILSFDQNPKKEGVLSVGTQWQWDGEQWNNLQGAPAYNYNSIEVPVFSTTAGGWSNYEVSMTIPNDWNLSASWFIKINGHNVWDDTLTANTAHGVTWVDNLFADFTLTTQTTQTPIYNSFQAKIVSVNDDGTILTLDKTFEEAALAMSENNITAQEYISENNPGVFDSFTVSYLVYNPYDLRTYLKFGNRMFLTTNFKKDVTSNPYPFSVIYKLYDALPANIVRLDECTVVKEMADIVDETVEIVDFVDTDPGDIVLRSPDIMNAESPVQRRTTDYKTSTNILSEDALVSDELQNEFLSQSMDSVDLNIDFTSYNNFVNFSSAKKRIQNFKYKVELIESYTETSASYIGVSGSGTDLAEWHHKIKDVKNNFDPFENYMYFKSSSYVSSSLGTFYDNAWPKTAGSGTITDPYVLAHTTGSTAKSWFNNSLISSSAYDVDNFNKLSTILPEHIKFDTSNDTYLTLVDMIGHHFDNIWVYIKALTDVYDRREKLTEGISRDLLMSVGQSLGWELKDGKDMISLSKYALGKEVTGSSYSNYSETSERDISREIWSRIINNMPFFLKNRGSVRAIKGLISAYGIPSTILRVKEYGGPDLPDDATPQFEISRKFTKALDFRSSQYVHTVWTSDDSSNRHPDTIEFRFRAATGSDQIIVEKQDSDGNPDFFIRLKDNDSVDDYGYVSFMISGSDGYKEVSSSNFPVYDGDFYSVMVQRTSGSDDINVSQSYQLDVGKYDAGFSKVDLYSQNTLDMSNSSSYNGQWSGSGTVYLGGKTDVSGVGIRFSGSLMEYRHWTEMLNTGSFKNHIGNPKAFDGNTISSSYNNMVLRYSFDDNKDLSSDTDGIRDVSANQTATYSGSHSGFTGNFYRNVTDETKSNVPSIGALRRVTNKIRIESNKVKPGFSLNADQRATISAYDTAPNDSNRVGVFFAPTDVINNDIINSVANLNFDQYLGDPRDRSKLEYRGLKSVSDNYWKKYTSPNNFWDYIRLLKYYDQSLFPQIRKMIPARAKPNLGILVEPNIFERPKTIIGRDPEVTTHYYSQSIDVSNDVVVVTSSFNIGKSIDDYDQWTGRIDMFSYETGSSVISSSGEFPFYSSSITEFADREAGLSIWQRINDPADEYYADVTMSFGDFHYNEFQQPSISGSRLHYRNQKLAKFYSTPYSASIDNYHSSSWYPVDIDNLAEERQALFNSYYAGVKNTLRTTQDGGPPIEVTITSPTKLVTKDEGESTLDTGEGVVAKFKPRKKKVKGGIRRRKPGRKPPSAEKAIEVAQQVKGDFLTTKETADIIKDFEKVSKTRKKKRRPKKKKNRPLSRQRAATPASGLGTRTSDPRSKKPKKQGKGKGKKKRGRLGGRRRR